MNLRLPWEREQDGRAGQGGFVIFDSKGIPLAHVLGRKLDEAREYAALIVEAVNSHDALKAQNAELVEALRGALSHLAAINWSNRGDNPLVRARAALAKAGGKP